MKYGYTRRSFVKAYAMPILCHAPRGEVRSGLPERLAVVLNQRPGLRAFMVTLTIKDGEDLKERFNKLRSGLKKYQQQRRDALKANALLSTPKRWVEFSQSKSNGGEILASGIPMCI